MAYEVGDKFHGLPADVYNDLIDAYPDWASYFTSVAGGSYYKFTGDDFAYLEFCEETDGEF